MSPSNAPSESTDASEPSQKFRDGTTFVVVTQPAGFLLKVELVAKVDLSPRQIFDILVDPHNERVFRTIKGETLRRTVKRVGHKRLVEVEQVSDWRFLLFRGHISTRLLVEEDPKACTLDFKLARRGVMKDFQGSWRLEPYSPAAYERAMQRISGAGERSRPAPPWAGLQASLAGAWPLRRPRSTVITLSQSVAPAHAPPPLDRLLRGISIRTVRTIVEDLQAEAARINKEEAARGVHCAAGGLFAQLRSC
mmetsp:Transcript_42417/g.108517  ORF Transcript_42417/g.108517 Transcript_42417/m.108517 type:complete len:251 (-) Transcript_42417:32-784(-)